MACHDDFGNGRHAHGIGSQPVEHPVLGGSLEGRSLCAEVDTFAQAYAPLAGHAAAEVAQLRVVGPAHVGEAVAVGVAAAQGMLGKEVDVVGDEHDVPHLQVGAHAARGVGDEQYFHSQLAHDADGVGDLLHRVALVVVKPPLHGQQGLPPEAPEQEVSAVSLYGGEGEVGHLAVGDGEGVVHFVGQGAEPAAQDERHLRAAAQVCGSLPAEEVSRFEYFVPHIR